MKSPKIENNVFLSVMDVHTLINCLEARHKSLSGLKGFKRQSAKLQKLIDKLYAVTFGPDRR